MKKYFNILVPVMFLFLLSCDKDDPVPSLEESSITSIAMLTTSSVQETQEISVTIQKGTPCYYVSGITKNISGNTFNYNIILGNDDNVCAQVITEEVVTVNFDPSSTGEYTLNFLINGKLSETRTVTVTE